MAQINHLVLIGFLVVLLSSLEPLNQLANKYKNLLVITPLYTSKTLHLLENIQNSLKFCPFDDKNLNTRCLT